MHLILHCCTLTLIIYNTETLWDVNLLCRLQVSKAVFPRVILLCLYREPQLQKTQKAPHHRPQTSSTENPNPKNPIQYPENQNLEPNHKWANMRKVWRINLGKIIAAVWWSLEHSRQNTYTYQLSKDHQLIGISLLSYNRNSQLDQNNSVYPSIVTFCLCYGRECFGTASLQYTVPHSMLFCWYINE